MKELTRFKFFLWYFGHFQVPLIGHLRPKLITLDERKIVIKLALRKRSKNHLNSMYFGALTVGADLAGGLHSFYHADCANLKISVAFKSFQAQFLRRPESDVYFVCEEGEIVKKMLLESKETGERINKPIQIRAFVDYLKNHEEVATFSLELSVKVLN